MLVCIRSPHEHGGSVVDNYDEPCQRDIAPRGEITGTAPAPSMVVASDLSGRASCTAKSARLGSVKTTTSRDIREKPHNSGFGCLGNPSNQAVGAGGGSRTRTPSRRTDFKSVASTDFATPANPIVSVPYTDMGLWAPKYAGFACCKSLQHNTTNFQRVPTAPSAFVRGFYPPGWARTLRALHARATSRIQPP